jgi:DNA-binding response OmpR family regulator
VRPQPHVLVIEDSPPVGEILRCALEQEGCSVVLVRTAHEGLAFARWLRPDAIVLDVGSDGAGFTAALIANRNLRAVPLVVLSARAADLAGCPRANIARVFGEPFYPSEVVAAVLETLTGSRMARPAARR